ncbi:MAG: rRNA maturation RNase YbeY [Candidatus Omnitrophica bacterium]|nr:rRNA maturation RNase YbeY [Candidatus Omnitrophota bacterium]
MPVELRAGGRVRLDLKRIRERAEFLLERVGRGEQVLSVLLTDDREMARIHERWTGEAGPTDVLSFPMEEQGILGDIVISAETAARRSRGKSEREVLRCLVHGVLHLTGHDHRTKAQKARMDRVARRLLSEIGGRIR